MVELHTDMCATDTGQVDLRPPLLPQTNKFSPVLLIFRPLFLQNKQ